MKVIGHVRFHVSSTIGYTEVCIMYLFRSEVMKNVMMYILSYIDQSLTRTVGPE